MVFLASPNGTTIMQTPEILEQGHATFKRIYIPTNKERSQSVVPRCVGSLCPWLPTVLIDNGEEVTLLVIEFWVVHQLLALFKKRSTLRLKLYIDSCSDEKLGYLIRNKMEYSGKMGWWTYGILVALRRSGMTLRKWRGCPR